MKKKLIVKILFLAVFVAVVYTGCSDSDSGSGNSGTRDEPRYSTSDTVTRYCLACHKSTYAAFADYTADTLGLEDNWLNPHRSAHGTNIPCRTCHEEDITGQQNTRCYDKTVKVSDACSAYCHEKQTLANPYPNL